MTWNTSAHVITQGLAGAFDNSVLYRPTLVIDGGTVHLWYGASTGGGWRIGYTSFPVKLFPPLPAP